MPASRTYRVTQTRVIEVQSAAGEIAAIHAADEVFSGRANHGHWRDDSGNQQPVAYTTTDPEVVVIRAVLSTPTTRGDLP